MPLETAMAHFHVLLELPVFLSIPTAFNGTEQVREICSPLVENPHRLQIHLLILVSIRLHEGGVLRAHVLWDQVRSRNVSDDVTRGVMMHAPCIPGAVFIPSPEPMSLPSYIVVRALPAVDLPVCVSRGFRMPMLIINRPASSFP